MPSLFRTPFQVTESWLSDRLPFGKRVALFAHYDPAGEVAPRVLATLQALRAADVCVLVVSNAGALQSSAWEALRPLCGAVLVRRNIGYDFGALREALWFWQLPHDETELLLLLNDSVLGPFAPLQPVLARVDLDTADVWAAADSVQRGWHLQSWFLAVGRRAMAHRAWAAFWAGVRPVRNKEWAVRRGELGFSRAMQRAGLRLRALWPQEDIVRGVFDPPRRFGSLAEVRQLARIRHYGNAGHALNPTADLWRQLLLAGCPFVKRELVERNPAGVIDAAEWRAVVAARYGEGANETPA